MIHQIRPSLVKLYIEEDVLMYMTDQSYNSEETTYSTLVRLGETFSIYREEKTRIKYQPMTIEMIEEKLTYDYVDMLNENVLSMVRR